MTTLRIKGTSDRLPKDKRRPELLLHPNIPKPLHGVNPRTVMGQEWWDEQRRIAYRKHNQHCHACGYYIQPLHAHEAYDIDYANGIVKLKEIVALCADCHSFIHSGLTTVRYENGEISQKDYERINNKGKKILREAGLKGVKPYEGEITEWEDWKLIIGEREFKPKFKSMSEWAHHYGYDLALEHDYDWYC